MCLWRFLEKLSVIIIGMKLLRRLSFLAFLIFAVPAHAQLNTDFLGAQTNLLAEPEFPQPGEEVTISFSNYGSQYHNADIIWQLNGQTVVDANNKRGVKFIAGKLNEPDIVSVSIVRSSGSSETFSVKIVPTYIDIILEAQTRVPGFYEGRALPSIGSRVNATVLVNDGSLLDGDYIYSWRLNGQTLENGPIRGTNQVSFDTPRGSQSTIHVAVTDLNGTVLGRRAIYFQSVKPDIVFYEVNPLYGQSHTAISNTLILIGTAATIVAEPYYLDIQTYNDPDINEWEINNVEQENTASNPYQITIQKVDEGGISRVSFHVRSTTELLQGVEESIQIAY